MLARANFIEMKAREIVKVYCSICGMLIRGLVPDTDFGIQRTHRGRTVVQERLRLACNAEYREVLMEMDDGSKHVTNACSECAGKLIGDADLREAIYASDLATWAFEGGQLPDAYFTRQPVRVLKIANVIGA